MKLLFTSIVSAGLFAQSVPMAHNDINQTGANTSEVILTPSNLSNFHKLGSWTTDGITFAQPLVAPGVVTSGTAHDLLIATSTAGTIYAFDANVPGSVVWSRHFSNARTSYPNSTGANTFAYGAPLGIISTPYVDQAGGYAYLVMQDTTPQYTLYQLNLSTGSILQSVVIAGSVTGTGDPGGGDCVSGGVLSFCASSEYVNRPGLVVANGNVYIAFGSTDVEPWHGWLFAYAVSNFSRVAVWCDTPNAEGASIWMSGGAPSVDGSGNIYVTTGNGDYDGITSYGESVLKLSPTLSLLDWFTPSNWATLNADDADVSSNRVLLIPGTTMAVLAAKDFNVYAFSTSCMGHLQGSSACALQNWKTNSGGTVTAFSGSYGMTFLNNVLYLPTTAGSIYAYTFSAGSFTTTPLATNIETFGTFGPAQMSGSSNGASNGILWASTATSSTFTAAKAGTLHAFNVTTLAELWNSNTTASDALGNLGKFSSPTVLNGRVYMGTSDGDVEVYGLQPSSQIVGSASLSGAATLQ